MELGRFSSRRSFLKAIGAGSVGAAMVPGLGTATGRSITIEGGGEDIWNTEDQFHFYHTAVEGDFDVTVHVDSMEDTDEWAKAGLMVRQRLVADAENAMVRYTPGNGTSMQWRSDDGEITDSTTSDDVGIGATDGSWLRLVRQGDVIDGYASTDGSDWSRIARLTTDHLDMSEDTHVGLAVTSHDRGTLCSATFDSLSGIDVSENGDIGDVAVSGSVSTERNGGSKTVDPGTYEIRSVNSGKVLDVAGKSTENGATLVQWESLGGPNQQWNVEYLGEGEYRLTARHSGQVAEVADGSTDDGADVRQWPWTGADHQRWRIEPAGDGTFLLRAVHSGKVIDVAGAQTRNGANVLQWTERGSDNQLWEFVPVDTGGDGGNDDGGNGDDGGDSVGTVAHFGPDDGFASTDWFDDDVEVIKVQEATRSAIEEALQTSGPRLVVFEESGVVDLEGGDLEITEDKCWVAGQTAPSPGITFVNGMFQVSANDCVVQHVRIFRGEDGDAAEGADPMNNADGTRNVVFDHVSSFWGRDENLSVGYGSERTTVANALVAEGLDEPAENSNGSLVGDGASDVAVLGTVYAKNADRNPRLKDDTESVVANTLVHRFDSAIAISEGAESAVVGNQYVGRLDWDEPIVFGDGAAHTADNLAPNRPEDVPFSSVESLDSPPVWPSGLDPLPASDVESHNLANAGARPADRIDHERRVIEDVRNRAGEIPGNEGEVGGYPDHGGSTRRLSVPDSDLRAWVDRWASAVEDPDASPPRN